MHTSKVVFKDGRKESGIIWSVRPREGWFTLIVDRGPDAESEELTIRMDECESVVTLGERISRNEIGDQDMLAEWAKRAEQEKQCKEKS